MFEGTRLAYVVPGYTGHIPKNCQESTGPFIEEKPSNHIPGRCSFILIVQGYGGYIQSMKSENLFSKTYGKTTYEIQHHQYFKGQDVPPVIRYKSHQQDIYQNQNNVQLRTAAEIVGVPKKSTSYQIPQSTTAQNFFQINENGTSQLQEAIRQTNFANSQTGQEYQDALEKFYGDEGKKDPLALGTPLPGYTGTQKRVIAANIFGQTFANTRRSALEDEAKIQNERKNNFKYQAINVPALKK